MTSSTLAAVASAALSLLFSYIPGFKNWFDPLHPNIKRLVMITMLISVAGISFGVACLGVGDLFKLKIPCSAYGALGLIQTLIAAIVTNQAVYLISPKSNRKSAEKSNDQETPEEKRVTSKRKRMRQQQNMRRYKETIKSRK